MLVKDMAVAARGPTKGSAIVCSHRLAAEGWISRELDIFSWSKGCDVRGPMRKPAQLGLEVGRRDHHQIGKTPVFVAGVRELGRMFVHWDPFV
jgi:hypothetical protein